MENRHEMMTREQLVDKYGGDSYLVVVGSRGNIECHRMSEDDAVRSYECTPEEDGNPKAEAYATIVCIPNPYGKPACHRGWIKPGYTWYTWLNAVDSCVVIKERQEAPGAVSATLRVEDKDLVITDPCYLIRDELWQELCAREFTNSRIRPRVIEVGGIKMVLADTIFGDWMRKLEGRSYSGDGAAISLGTFTADAGMVCAVAFEKTDPRDALAKLPPICWAIVPSFTGSVTIVHRDNECQVTGVGNSNGRRITFKSRQVG